MALTTLQILTLSNLKGVGPKSILNFGNAYREVKSSGCIVYWKN